MPDKPNDAAPYRPGTGTGFVVTFFVCLVATFLVVIGMLGRVLPDDLIPNLVAGH